MRSAFDGTASRWYLAAILIFKRLTSSLVADGLESNFSIISRRATWFKSGIPKDGLAYTVIKRTNKTKGLNAKKAN